MSEVFKAKSKETGRIVTYQSKDARDKAIKAGRSTQIQKKQTTKKSNIFAPKGKSKVKKKPFEIPKIQVPKFNLPKFKLKKLTPTQSLKAAEKGRKEKEKARARTDRKPNMKNGVDVIRNKKDEKHFIDDFYYKADEGHDIKKLEQDIKNQYQEQKKKLSKKEQKQQEKDIKSWKKLGGFEAIQDAINGGEITEQEIRERNERMSNRAHKTVNTINKPIERGIDVDNDIASIIVDRFKVGGMVEIPEEKGHGSSGFSISGGEARYFTRADNEDVEKTSILFKIKPNSKGQIRGSYIDGEEGDKFQGEKEIIRSSKSKAKVIEIQTKKMSSGKILKIIILQETDDLTETIVNESNKKYSDISRRYLEGPLNPKPRKKVKEDISPDVIKSFTIQDKLNSNIWENGKLKVEILKKLRKIGKDFFNDLDLEPNVKLHDITLTGSISNYNWSKFSDVDLHLRLDFSEVDDDKDFVKNYMLAKKTIWNDKHDITIYDFPVEVYVEDIGDTHIASGLYSVLKHKWLVIPKKKELKIDFDDIRSKAEGYVGSIDTLKELMSLGRYKKVIQMIENIKMKLKRMRQSGLERGGEFSVENLAFKVLRRSPFIATISKMKDDAYDKLMTMEGVLKEDIKIPIKVGDTVKMGRFKNKKVKIKSIKWNEKGDLLFNGKPALKFRLPKKQVSECVAFSKKFGDDVVLGKNRDRNYTPELKVVREMSGNGIELCYMVDQDTDWSEGMNSNGIGLVNSALFVKRDEKDFDKSKKEKAPSKDGIRIRHALSKDTLTEVVKSLVNFDTGVKGHTIVSDGNKLVVIENTSRTSPKIKVHDINKSPVVRSNHGIEHPEQGYTRGDDRVSSELRMKNASELLGKEKNYKEILPQFYNHTQEMGPKYDLVRAQNKLWTSSQILMNLNKKEMILYLIPGAVKFVGVENRLPKNHESKINLKVRQYEHSPHDKYDTFVTTDEKPKKSAIKDSDIVVEVINEGVDDPGILKAVFLAGGPGSGKTWVARGLFGIPDRVNVSQTGLKMVNSDKELKFLLNKFGFGTNLDMLPDQLFRQLTDPKSSDYSGLRTFAKELTGVRKKQYMNGRLGMIIDGTGDDFKEIRKQKKEVEKLGYDTYMVFINTSLEIALSRNEKRDRVLPVSIVKNSHREVVKNIGGYQGLFGGSNFLIVDNNKDLDEESAQKRFNMLVKRGISKFVKTPIKNKIGKGWVSKNRILKKMTKENFVNENKPVKTNFKLARLIVKKYGLKSKVVLSKRSGTSTGDYSVEYDTIELRKEYENVAEFIISVLHEIKHALDAKDLKPKKFLKKYKQASKIAAYQGLDRHDANKWEKRAESWAQREWKNKWKNKLEKI